MHLVEIYINGEPYGESTDTFEKGDVDWNIFGQQEIFPFVPCENKQCTLPHLSYQRYICMYVLCPDEALRNAGMHAKVRVTSHDACRVGMFRYPCRD